MCHAKRSQSQLLTMRDSPSPPLAPLLHFLRLVRPTDQRQLGVSALFSSPTVVALVTAAERSGVVTVPQAPIAQLLRNFAVLDRHFVRIAPTADVCSDPRVLHTEISAELLRSESSP